MTKHLLENISESGGRKRKSVEKLLKENNRREDYKSIQEENKITANMKDKFNRME